MDCTKEMKGFSLVRNVGLSELSVVLHEHIHTKTGLKLVWLDRDEDNKTFGIAFETQPENDTGFPHPGAFGAVRIGSLSREGAFC